MRSIGKMHQPGLDLYGEGSSNEEGRIKAWFKSVESDYTDNYGTHVSFTTKVTVIGLENIHRLLKEWGYC